MTSDALDDLASRAGERRVVIIGGGIAGLVAAWECAKIGMAVTVLEASDRLGGVVGHTRIADLDLELGATCWSTRGGVVRRLLDEVAPDAVPAQPDTDAEWIAGIPTVGAAPVPHATVLGIPANPWDEQVRRVIGWRGAWRAYVDRLRPPLTIGAARNLGRLVRSRMGATVHDRLVAPLSIDRFGLRPDQVDVEVAAPGLNPALTRTGSLAGAVSELRLDAAAGPSYEGLVGGMPQLVAALESRLVELGADIRTGTRATALTAVDGRWIVTADTADAVAPAGAEAGDEPAARDRTQADAVIVATDEAAARGLLADLLAASPTEAGPHGIPREVVTIVVDAPALDAVPRGAQVHAIPGTHRAVGLTHETARWRWLADAAGAGRHVIRVAFGGPDDAPATASLNDAQACGLAVAEASALLGVPLSEADVVGAHRERYTLVPPASAFGHAEATAGIRSRIAGRAGLAAVGAWLAGSGLAQVIADAQAEADRVRRAELWGAASGP